MARVRASHRKIRWRGEWHDLMKAQSALLAPVWDNSVDQVSDNARALSRIIDVPSQCLSIQVIQVTLPNSGVGGNFN